MEKAKSCVKCDRPDSADNLVSCDQCSVWLHYGCALVTSSIANTERSYKCDNCRNEVASVHSEVSTRASKRSKRIELAVKLLDEQRAFRVRQQAEEEVLRQKRLAEEDEIRKRRAAQEEQYLKEKMDLLLSVEESDDERGSRRSRVSSRVSRQRVQQWLVAKEQYPPTKTTSNVVPPVLYTEATQQPVSTTTTCSGLSVQPTQPPPVCDADLTEVRPLKLPQSTSTPRVVKVGNISNVKQPRSRSDMLPDSEHYNKYENVGILGNVVLSTNTNVGSQVSSIAYSLGNVYSTPIMSTVPAKSLHNNCFPMGHQTTPFPQVPSSSTVYPSQPVETQASGVCFEKPAVSLESYTRTTHSVYNTALLPDASATNPLTTFYSADESRHEPAIQWPNVATAPPMNTAVNERGYSPIMTSAVQPQQWPTAAQIAARQVVHRELPSFSGDPQEWPLFFSVFCNSTSTCGFSNAENLARLQRCLKGQALESVKSRLLIPESVPAVIDTLYMLYGRPEILIHSVLNKLRAVLAPKGDNLPSIITFGLAVQNVVDHMVMANLNDHLANPMLLHELVEKLPSHFKLEWSKFKRGQTHVNLATFGNFMSELVQMISDVTIPSTVDGPTTKNKARDKPKLFVHTEPPTSAVKAAGSNEGVKGSSCWYCSDADHKIAECRDFKSLDIDGRWKTVKLKGLCKGCLIPHRRWPCRSVKECGVQDCRIRHHELLHSPRLPGPKPVVTSSGVLHQNHHSSIPCSLFRYVPVTVYGNGCQVDTFAFLDDGSSATLIEDSVIGELGITGPADTLLLSWTGDIVREEKNSRRVTVIVSGQRLKQQHKLCNVRTVTHLKLPSQTLLYDSLKEQYPHLKGLPIESYMDAVPRMIIGVEHARLLTTLKVREGRGDDPIAAKTRLGWCIFGKLLSKSVSVERLSFFMSKCGSFSWWKQPLHLKNPKATVKGGLVKSWSVLQDESTADLKRVSCGNMTKRFCLIATRWR